MSKIICQNQHETENVERNFDMNKRRLRILYSKSNFRSQMIDDNRKIELHEIK